MGLWWDCDGLWWDYIGLYRIIIPVEIWGKRFSPLDIGTFWLGTTPKHYRKPGQVKHYSLQKPNYIRYKKISHKPNGFKDHQNRVIKNWSAFCICPVLLPKSFLFLALPGHDVCSKGTFCSLSWHRSLNQEITYMYIYILSCKEQCGQPSYLERARCKNLTRLRESWQAVTKKRLHIHSMQLYACTYLVGTKWKPTKTEPTLLQFG